MVASGRKKSIKEWRSESAITIGSMRSRTWKNCGLDGCSVYLLDKDRPGDIYLRLINNSKNLRGSASSRGTHQAGESWSLAAAEACPVLTTLWKKHHKTKRPIPNTRWQRIPTRPKTNSGMRCESNNPLLYSYSPHISKPNALWPHSDELGTSRAGTIIIILW